jgi:S-phase kinase-associated protein 1
MILRKSIRIPARQPKTSCAPPEDPGFQRGAENFMSKTVRFSSSDKQEFVVNKEVACQSVLIKNMLEDIGEDSDTAIPLPNVTSHILAKIIEYCEAHKDDPAPPPEEEIKAKSSEEISDADREFINVDQGTLFEIILAANYLDIKPLLDLGTLI